MKIFGKQPALWLGIVGAALAMLMTFHGVAVELHLTDERVGAIMAGLFAVLGAYEAWVVRDTMLAALTALGKAAIAILLAYNFEISADQTAAILGFLSIASGLIIRDRTSPLVVPTFKSTEASPVLTQGNLSLVA